MSSVVTEQEIEREVRAFLAESAATSGANVAALARDALIWAAVDSLSLLDLVEYLEKVFSFRIDPMDFIPENMETIGRIVTFVARSLKGRE